MFRPRDGSAKRTLLLTTIGLLVAVIVSTTTTIWMAVEVSQDQGEIERIVEAQPQRALEQLQRWKSNRRWELGSILMDLVVLAAAGGALVLVWRAYAASQRSLHEVRTLAWDILASIDRAVVTSNTEGVITSINPLARNLLSIDDGAVGRTLDSVFRPTLPLADVAATVLESHSSEYDRDFTVEREGHTVRLRTEGHLLRDTDDSIIGVALYVRDVTERVLVEEQMKRMERFMGLGTLAAGLHHEIKNPLSALSLHVQLLEEGLEGNEDHDVEENLGVLKTEVTRINGVLESFRDFASLETLKRTETDLSELLQQTADLVRPKAEQQRVKLRVELPDQSPPNVSADSGRLEQVLLNLVLNSLDSMKDGGSLGLRLHQDNGSVKIDISDTGPGIPENVRDRIFDPCFTTKTDGSGMGLAVCDKVIQQHNGRIAFDTSPTGTTFHISLLAETN